MNILTRQAMFLNAINTKTPEFYTKNTVIHETPILILREFRAGKSQTLIVPPAAGHHSSIADYDEYQSLVQTVLDSTTGGVYCIEWKPATQATKNTGIAGLIRELRAVVGSDTHLIGLCQGGWLATIYAALYPNDLSKLTIAGAPIDTHAQGGDLQKIVQGVPQSVYAATVRSFGGVMPGKVMLKSWKSMNMMDRYLIDFQKLWNATTDAEKTRRIKKFRTWYEYTQDIHGKWYLEAVDLLFRQNLLPTGKLVVNGRKVLLSNITCPIVCITGSDDDITLDEQCSNLVNFVSSDRMDHYSIPNCGHVGVFMGTESQKVWRWSLSN